MKRRRARHYWDPELHFSRYMAAALGIADANAPDGTHTHRIAWDVYLLYPRGGAPVESPEFWMHQLDTTVAPRLDVPLLGDRISALLARSA